MISVQRPITPLLPFIATRELSTWWTPWSVKNVDYLFLTKQSSKIMNLMLTLEHLKHNSSANIVTSALLTNVLLKSTRGPTLARGRTFANFVEKDSHPGGLLWITSDFILVWSHMPVDIVTASLSRELQSMSMSTHTTRQRWLMLGPKKNIIFYNYNQIKRNLSKNKIRKIS